MTDKTKPMTGGCMCGAVRYELSAAPLEVLYCHCRMCQQSQGGIFSVGAAFPRDALTLTQGAPKFHKSSEFGERGFCGDCGTHMMFRYRDSDTVYVYLGGIDHPENLAPTSHMGIESQMPWLTISDDLPRMRTDDYAAVAVAKAAAGQGEE